MSVRIMSEIWAHSQYAQERLLVLLALADWANEEGICFPSIPQIAHKARITERAVYAILKELKLTGIVTVIDPGGGRGKTSTYQINPEVETLFLQNPEAGDIKTLNVGERKRERKESNKEKKERKKSREPSLEPSREFLTGIPDWLPVEAWRAFVDMRRKIRKPLTDHAVKLAFRRLETLKDSGQDPQAVLEQSILHDYQGLFAVREDKANGTSKQSLFDAIRDSRRKPDFGRSPVPDDIKLAH